MSKPRITIAAIAKLSGVTVRTLRHYDEIGLLVPSRGRGDYRLYSEADVLRLQQILVYRELGLPLQRIKAVMDDPAFSAASALEEQRAHLEARAQNTQRLLAAVDSALARLRGESAPELAALFDGFAPSVYEEETRERWGHTSAYAESHRRTREYSAEQWVAIKAEAAAILTKVGEALDTAVEPSSNEGIALAEAYRLHIDRWFYPCDRAMYREVASMYTSDPRFRETLDRDRDGVAAFLTAAAQANG